MTSSVHSLSDNSEADEQQKHAESHLQPSSPANGMCHPGIASPTMPYGAPAQVGVGNTMAQTAYPYPDPYYRSIFAPYETQPYTAQPYPTQPMVHLQLMGIQQAGVPLPSEAVEEPVFVNAKQYHGILRRRQSRAKAESENKLSKSRKSAEEARHFRCKVAIKIECDPGFVVWHISCPLFGGRMALPIRISVHSILYQPYLHESRHLHALRRARGTGGRFQKKTDDQKKEVESSQKSQENINLNTEKDGSQESAP